MVWWDLQDTYANTLGTLYLAEPFDRFNDNNYDGLSATLPYPYLYEGNDGLTYDPNTQVNSIIARTRPIAINIFKNVPIGFNGQQMTFFAASDSYDMFFRKYIGPGVTRLANMVASDCMDQIITTFSDSIGNPSQPLNGVDTMTAINAQFANMGIAHIAEKYFGMSPLSSASFQVPYATYYNPTMNYPILKNDNNDLGIFGGAYCYMDQLIKQVMNGTFATSGTVTLSATPATVATPDTPMTIQASGFTPSSTGVLLFNNLIYFGIPSNPVNAVNPDTRFPYATNKTFSVLYQINSDGSGNAEYNDPVLGTTLGIPIYPAICVSGPYQNVSRPVVLNDQVNMVGTAHQVITRNLAWVRPGLRFANPGIATGLLNSGTKGMQLGGLVLQETFKVDVPDTDLSFAFTLSAQGSDSQFLTTITSRAAAGLAPFNGYGFQVLST